VVEFHAIRRIINESFWSESSFFRVIYLMCCWGKSDSELIDRLTFSLEFFLHVVTFTLSMRNQSGKR